MEHGLECISTSIIQLSIFLFYTETKKNQVRPSKSPFLKLNLDADRLLTLRKKIVIKIIRFLLWYSILRILKTFLLRG